jgi:hypothetical protein
MKNHFRNSSKSRFFSNKILTKFIFFVQIFFFNFCEMGFAENNKLQPISSSFVEHSSGVTVSGQIRNGVMEGALNERIYPNQLTIYLPKVDKGKLCVKIISMDGIHEGRLEYDISGKEAGPFIAGLTASPPSWIKKYKSGELAVLAQLKSDCDPSVDTNRFFVASWTKRRKVKSFNVLVNSNGAGVVLLLIPKNEEGEEKGDEVVKCLKIERTIAQTAYDTVCRFDVSKEYDYSDMLIELESFGTLLADRKLPLFLP